MEVRFVEPKDAGPLDELIRMLAEFEVVEGIGKVTPEVLKKEMLDENSAFGCVVVEIDGQIIGYALFFQAFSTQDGRYLYLRDIFVKEEYRRKGAGKVLLRALAEICVERGYARIDLTVLRTNSSAFDFYKAFGAEIVEQWVVVRINKDAIEDIAAGAHDKALSS